MDINTETEASFEGVEVVQPLSYGNDYENSRRIKCGEIYYDEDHQIVLHCLLCDFFVQSECSGNFNINFLKHFESHFEDATMVDKEENESKTVKNQIVKIEYSSDEEYEKDKYIKTYIQDVREFINLKESADKVELIEPDIDSNAVENNVEMETVLELSSAGFKKGVDQIELPIVEKSKKDNKYHCSYEDCGKSTETEKLIQIHMRNIHILDLQIKNGRYYCPLCNSSFTRKHAATAHLLKVHEILTSVEVDLKPTDGKYHCPLCNQSWQKLHNINSHLRYQHENYFNDLLEKQQNDIASLGNVVKQDVIIESHPIYKDIKDDGLWHCPFCGIKKILNKRQIAQHILRNHRDVKKKIKILCEICGKESSGYGAAKQHKLMHSGEKPYKCDFCGKEFACQSNCKTHMRIHTSEKRYSCSFCDKRFISSTEKKMHELIQHIKEKRFECEVCKRKFYKRFDLTRHTRRHTGDRPYTCEICSKSFYEGSQLKDHMISHSKTKTFECDICNAMFPRKKSLRAHKQTHSTIKKYHCEACGLRFAQCAGLYSHKKTHHKDLLKKTD